MGIEPTLAAWEAAVLPLNYTRFLLSIRRLRLYCTTMMVAQATSVDTSRDGGARIGQPTRFIQMKMLCESPRSTIPTSEILARDFVSNFQTSVEKSDVAGVELRSDRLFNSKATLKFWGSLKLVWGIEGNPSAHHDWVVQEWVDSRVGFTAQTLKRTFADLDDLAAGVPVHAATVPVSPLGSIGAAIFAVDAGSATMLTNSDSGGALQASRQYMDMAPLYPTILPPG